MAIARTSHLIGAISGPLDSVIFANTRQGLLLKTRPLKINQRSEKQLARRALFQTVTNYWQNLDQEDYDAWRDAAADVTKTNRLGIKSQISPWQLFLQQNMLTLWANGDLSTTPIPNRQTVACIDATIAFTAGGAYNVTMVDPGGDQIIGIVYGARSYRTTPPVKWTPKTWTFVEFAGWSFGSTVDVSTDWDANIGAPVEDEMVAVKLVLYPYAIFWPPGPPRTFVTQMA